MFTAEKSFIVLGKLTLKNLLNHINQSIVRLNLNVKSLFLCDYYFFLIFELIKFQCSLIFYHFLKTCSMIIFLSVFQKSSYKVCLPSYKIFDLHLLISVIFENC